MKPVTVIGIGGLAATGTSTLLKQLSKRLPKWAPRSAGESVRALYLLRSHHNEHLSLPEFIKQTPGFDEEVERRNQEFVSRHRNGCLLEARLVILAMAGMSCARKVLLHCDDSVRICREIERSRRRGHIITSDEAHEMVLGRDRKDRERYEALYRLSDFDHPDHYHLTIDTGVHDPEACCDMILKEFGIE